MRKTLILSMLLMLVGTSWAQQVSQEQALQKATEFRQELSTTPQIARRGKTLNNAGKLSLAYTAEKTGTTLYYIFNNPGGGWVIVAGDEVAEEILGYSCSGSFDYENIPSNMKHWLEGYEKEISFAIQQSGVEGQKSTAHGLKKNAMKREASKVNVPYLIKTKWDQDAPYNNNCPIKDGEHCLTGCVATAMAQVMRYYEWPEKGYGSHTYTDTPQNGWGTGKTLTANFSEHTYDWGKMPYDTGSFTMDSYKAAVALLMSDCGISVNMTYGTYDEGGSGAWADLIPNALTKYFNYKTSAKYVTRNNYSLSGWKDLLYNELAAKRPVIYGGEGEEGGHEFICDGYEASTTKFHFNWGWSGEEDGYFAIGALDPGYEFNTNNDAVIGIEPDKTGYKETYSIIWCSNNDFYEMNNCAVGEGLTLPSTEPYIEGYTFMGWTLQENISTDGSGIEYVSSSTVPTEDDTYIYAVFAKEKEAEEGEGVTYSFEILPTNFNGISYIANNSAKTSIATATDGSGKTMEVEWMSNQAMLKDGVIQFQKNAGSIYNTTFLGTVVAVDVVKTTESIITTYTGNEVQPTGSETGGYFLVKAGNATGKVEKISVKFCRKGTSYTDYTFGPATVIPDPVECTVTFIDKGETYKVMKVNSGITFADLFTQITTPINDDENFEGYEFLGWSTENSAASHSLVNASDKVTKDMNLYAIYSKSGATGWTQTTTVAVGDEVVFAEIDTPSKMEMSSFSSSSTVYGMGTSFEDTPIGTMTFVVERGTQDGTFAFRNTTSNKYLYWPKDKNSVSEQADKNDYASWKVLQSSGRGLMQNYCKDSDGKERYMIWNNGSPRFACYTYKSHGTNINGIYYYYTVFYKNGGMQYSLETGPEMPYEEEGDAPTGLEIPAYEQGALIADHTTKKDGKKVRTYALEFDETHHHARWVAFRFDGNTRLNSSSVERTNFHDDPLLPPSCWISNDAFSNITIGGTTYELDRGHLCAFADRKYNQEAASQTFYMSNMSPQMKTFNSGYWNNLESLVQNLGRDESFSDTLYVVKGGTLTSGNVIGALERTYNGEKRYISIPKYYYMALLKVKKDATKGLGYKAVGFLAEHKKYSDNSAFSHPENVVSIDELEELTGIDFFPGLPDDVENVVESATITNNVRKDWGFTSLTASSDDYKWTYHNPSTNVSTTPVSDFAYATFYNDMPKTIPENVEAYIATEKSGNIVSAKKLEGDVIPAGCGVILRSAESDTFAMVDAKGKATDKVSDNLLVGWTADHTIVGTTSTGYYALNYNLSGSEKEIGFFAPQGAGSPHGNFTAKGGKAYLKIDGAKTLSIHIEGLDISNAIAGIENNLPQDDTRYNLQGIRVNAQYKGIIVVGGKKYLNK